MDREVAGGARWCTACGTRHAARGECPGLGEATGAERPGWRINVDTPEGIVAYGVLLAPTRGAWRARILTYPNVLWLVPGGATSIKFVGDTAEAAERQAERYIRRHCSSRGFEIRDAPGCRAHGDTETAPTARRKIRFLPVRFGVAGPTETGKTGNLSETGMFIITDSPVVRGKRLSVRLGVEGKMLELRARVRWMRKRHHAGESPGMGVELEAAPPAYLAFVRALP